MTYLLLIIYCGVGFFSRSEQYFGSPSDMASAAEHIREKMKLVSLKKQQLRQPEATTPES